MAFPNFRTNDMRIRLFLFLLALAPIRPAYAVWDRQVFNYTHRDYGAATQNWMIEQQENGWIYVANNKGLLEYDGENWALYPVTGHKIRSLKKSGDGRIYIGAINELGYFEPDSAGGLRYTSLAGELRKTVHIGVIRNVLLNAGRVYFQDDRYIVYLENGELHTLDTGGTIATSAVINQQFMVVTDKGLAAAVDDGLHLLPESEKLGKLKVVKLLPHKDRILVVTRFDGLFTYDPQEGLRPYRTSVDAYIRKNGAICAARLGSRIAIGTVQDGVCVLDLETDRSQILSTATGLQNKTVQAILFDRDGNLWLGLDSGIDYVAITSPIQALYGNRADIGSGYASAFFGGKLYLGTNQGIYRTSIPDEPDGSGEVAFVEKTNGQAWQLFPHDGQLFGATEQGVFVIEPSGTVQHIDGLWGVRQIIALPGQENTLIAGTYGVGRGIYLLRREEGKAWQVVQKIDSCTVSCKSLLADPHDDRVVWIANKGDGVLRMQLSEDLKRIVAQKNYRSESLQVTNDFHLAVIDDTVCVASQYGLWNYDRSNDRLIRNRRLEAATAEADGRYCYLEKDTYNNLWYSDGRSMRVLRYDDQRDRYFKRPGELYLHKLLIEHFEHVSTFDRHAVLCSEGGFSLLDLDAAPPRSGNPSVTIRRVWLTEPSDSLLYGRNYPADEAEELVIPYGCNSLRFEYSAVNYRHTQPTGYACRLDSEHETGSWSEYRETNVKEFTNLHEGRYVFHVRASVADGEEQASTSIAFRVLPPWYRTWWSYLIYLALSGAGVGYLIRRIDKSRKRLVKQKDLELRQQEEGFKKENERKELEIDSLKEEVLRAELRHKSEELVNSTLNIVRKNEILLNIKKAATNIYQTLNEENPVSLRRKVIRLIGQIDENIAHDNDLQHFQHTFDSVHNGFFDRLTAAYPELTKKEQLLCAYIKMDLLSKEIAPLMSISVRGVEVSRYRIRKKLGLDEGANLAEFLRKFTQE